METVLFVNARQDSQVKDAIPEIHAHQIHVIWEYVHRWVNNFNAHVCHHSKDQHVLIKIRANQIHVKMVVNATKWVMAA